MTVFAPEAQRRTGMVQGKTDAESLRPKLIGLLPRLRRFAAVLAGDGPGCDDLLRAACEKMLGGMFSYQRGTPFDRWAFARMYVLWLESLRDHTEPMAQGKGDESLFQAAFTGADGKKSETAETAAILAKLPPQQRCALLLIYGEGFTYDEAAQILDAPTQTVMERATRALSVVIERAGLMGGGTASGAQIESFYPTKRQAG